VRMKRSDRPRCIPIHEPQIYYRLRKAKVRRSEFREGNSSLAKIVIESASAPAGRVLKQKLLEDQAIDV